MPSDDGTVTINQVQQAIPSDKSAEQNTVITPETSQGFLTLPGACKNPLVSTEFSLGYKKHCKCQKKLASRSWPMLFTLTYVFLIHTLSSSAGK